MSGKAHKCCFFKCLWADIEGNAAPAIAQFTPAATVQDVHNLVAAQQEMH
jgi:hypothetical protein